jgi:dTDP-N-acetylfucosamine:lipid II N-acetylfucosaminyltransferase
MIILHIITASNISVIESYIRFINENFDSNVHRFIFLGSFTNLPGETKKYNNITCCHTNAQIFNLLVNKMRKSDKIIFHSSLGTLYKFYALISPKIIKKIYWVAWGADLYEIGKKGRGIKKIIKKIIGTAFARRIEYFVGIFPPDIEFFKKEFNSHAQTFYASYMGSLYNPLYKTELNLPTLEEKIINKDIINIQVGHSATPILNHISVLNALHRFKNENIKIYIPLSYGNIEYGNQVQRYAESLFEDKAVCIRQMMSKSDYMKFLSMIDIAIFNTPRQIGLGNLGPLLYMGKKIFMPADTIMYNYYKFKDINICDYNQINYISFDMFIEPVCMQKAKQYYKWSPENRLKKIEMWEKVFDITKE